MFQIKNYVVVSGEGFFWSVRNDQKRVYVVSKGPTFTHYFVFIPWTTQSYIFYEIEVDSNSWNWWVMVTL